MKLHGTTAPIPSAIQARSIQPRVVTKSKGNWTHTVSSNRNAVYLTDGYALYFADSATKRGQQGLVLEIKGDWLLPWKTCPDEDVLEQKTRKLGPTGRQPDLVPTNWPIRWDDGLGRAHPLLAAPGSDRLSLGRPVTSFGAGEAAASFC